MFALSVHCSVNVYVRPSFAPPERSARRLTVRSPVICESAALAPSLPVTLTILQEAEQLSVTLTSTDTGSILPLGGQSVLGAAVTLVLAKGKECGVKDAGGFGTPRATPNARSRASSDGPSSHNSRRACISVSIVENSVVPSA